LCVGESMFMCDFVGDWKHFQRVALYMKTH
jgi:hypothetical protein